MTVRLPSGWIPTTSLTNQLTLLLRDSFYSRSSIEVAPDLLGKNLCMENETGKLRKLIITETEAYHGKDDLASHAYKGMTERNKLMFGPANFWYLYLCYGMHWMLNLVTAERGNPSAVFIRATDEISGPGRLTKKLGIDNRFHGLKNSPLSKLWVEDSTLKPLEIQRGPRIGVESAGPIWSKKAHRFWFSKGSSVR